MLPPKLKRMGQCRKAKEKPNRKQPHLRESATGTFVLSGVKCDRGRLAPRFLRKLRVAQEFGEHNRAPLTPVGPPVLQRPVELLRIFIFAAFQKSNPGAGIGRNHRSAPSGFAVTLVLTHFVVRCPTGERTPRCLR